MSSVDWSRCVKKVAASQQPLDAAGNSIALMTQCCLQWQTRSHLCQQVRLFSHSGFFIPLASLLDPPPSPAAGDADRVHVEETDLFGMLWPIFHSATEFQESFGSQAFSGNIS